MSFPGNDTRLVVDERTHGQESRGRKWERAPAGPESDDGGLQASREMKPTNKEPDMIDTPKIPQLITIEQLADRL